MKLPEFVYLARYILEHDIDIESDLPDANVIMRRDKSETNRRVFLELVRRMQALTTQQRKILTTLDADGKAQLAFLAICKAYPLIYDFVVEVVREKFVVLDFILTDANYQTFINRKSELHDELLEFSPSTLKKGRQVIWRILEQAGMITDTTERKIIPQFVHPKVVQVIKSEDPGLLKIFLYSDHQIKNLIA